MHNYDFITNNLASRQVAVLARSLLMKYEGDDSYCVCKFFTRKEKQKKNIRNVKRCRNGTPKSMQAV